MTPFKHLVVLMMENRSFDHMLGYLMMPDYPIEGLNGDETNKSANGGPPVRVSADARSIGDLTPDPAHEFPDINYQIFSRADGADTGQEKMQGFVQNYAAHSGNAQHGDNVMKCFHPGTVPVLSTLAKNYAICDHWFASVPASTIPNRLFAHAAASGSSLTQDAVLAPASARTIFEVIDDRNNDATYRIYTSGPSILMANIYLARRQNKFFDYSRFEKDCVDNLLPEYTFIEPSYGDDLSRGLFANSQHPDFPVDAGEQFIAGVYKAIRKSPEWNDTLLLIVYDEHGGLFDHVTPPVLTPNPRYPDLPATKDFGFGFNRLGVRVPAVFVSPRIRPGTIFRQPFDHCSIVATARKLFCLDTNPFNWREAQAGTFDAIANLGNDEVRTDTVEVPNAVSSNGTIPLQRSEILSSAEREAITSAIVADGGKPAMHIAEAGSKTATAPAIAHPDLRKPTDLMVLMARAMNHSLEVMGMRTQRQVNQIHSAQDASDYLQEAVSLIKTRGGAQ